MHKLTLLAGCALACVALSGCAGLPGTATGLDPRFLDGVKEVLTDTHCAHHDEFRTTIGAAGIPASTTIVAARDCAAVPGVPATPTPAAVAGAAVGVAPTTFGTAPPSP